MLVQIHATLRNRYVDLRNGGRRCRAGSPRYARHHRGPREGSGVRLVHVRRGVDRRQARGVHRDVADCARRARQLRAHPRAHVRGERRVQAALRRSSRGQRSRAAPGRQTADAILAKQRAGFENQVAEMRKLFDQITPEQRATLEEGWKQMRRAVRRDGKGRAAQADRGASSRNSAPGSLRRARRGHEGVRKDLPRGPSGAGGHAAPPLPRGHQRRRFHRPARRQGQEEGASPTPPSRPSRASGKCAFRAGKPATDAARTFAQKWLADLQAQGVK